ncbi:MAG TPA: 4-alpha-glucanotransferase [Leptospiraceae bacterium]|nr:4-alpha-glucanotransferase [Leptospiraceae bacterium]HMW06685.1 4-alpha-glucanotransferase [Leptospiraceae bacterium]HMX31935.1 4-alpha-glucanotransferase [Leptospiraceae bacterium]HMY33606.1 4-alpha-glucanotransferase [Leptospiraceae bacterium]HMZ64919.1 4-alpha-glucanotransferase [Leptospiraceae bacterium]
MSSNDSSKKLPSIRKSIIGSKRAGVSFPLLALLTRDSFEGGDFHTLELMADWAKKTGVSIIQILPLNDLGNGKSPYSSISAFAIDPLYISLHKLGINIRSRKERIASLEINMLRIRELKIQNLRIHYNKIYNESLKEIIRNFMNQHPWIASYGAFKVLYNRNGGAHWRDWNYGRDYTINLQKEIMKENEEEFYFILWIQYIAYQQLRDVKKKFEQEGIFLKGDMPILTSSNSADVWARTDLFDLSLNSGAPPDNFSDEGQNWHFPIINWDKMKAENYAWWKERLEYLEHFYHLYRIDHVLGMYRIWAIPLSAKSAKFGYYHPQTGVSRKEFEEVKLDADDFLAREIIYEFQKDKFIFYWDFYKLPGYYTLPEEVKKVLYPLSHKHLEEDEKEWRREGEDVLNFFFENTEMQACAEDLGAVPSFVRDSIHENKIIGLDIIRWTRSFEDGSFIPADKYRPLAVSSLSVHDTSIALDWWNSCSKEDQKSFAELIDLTEAEISATKVMKAMLRFALSTNSLFSINLLHDFMFDESYFPEKFSPNNMLAYPERHRINIPGTPEEKNWSYRFPFLVEDLLANTGHIKEIRMLIDEAGRIHE